MVNYVSINNETIEPESVPQFLAGDLGLQVFDIARKLAETKYQAREGSPLLTPVYEGGVVKHSNPFFVCSVQEALNELGVDLHVATQADIEETLRKGDTLRIKGNHYVDTALVLRSLQDSYKANNNPLARDLEAQLRKELGEELRLPVMIPLRGLALKVADNPYGLGFILTEDALVVHDNILNQPGYFNQDDINKETGLPRETRKEGSRYLYTKEEGLSRLYVDNDLNLIANWLNLDYWGDSGRVVVAKNFSSGNPVLEAKVAELKAEKSKIIQGIEQRYQRAIAILHRKE